MKYMIVKYYCLPDTGLCVYLLTHMQTCHVVPQKNEKRVFPYRHAIQEAHKCRVSKIKTQTRTELGPSLA